MKNVLTPKQTEILAFVAKGFTDEEIGKELNISKPTVKNYLSYVYSTLAARNRTEAACIAIKKGYI